MTRKKTQIPMLRYLSYALLIVFLFASGCVSRQRYDEMSQVAEYYRQQAADVDSLSLYNTELSQEGGSLSKDSRDQIQTIERLTATNISLNRSYQDLLSRYNALVDQNQDVLSTSGREVTDLQQSLAEYEAELIRKERELEALEYEIAEREAEIERLENGAVSEYSTVTARDRRLRDAQSNIQAQRNRLLQLNSGLLQGLVGFGNNELNVREQSGRLYLTLNEVLLFSSGGTQLSQRGRQALRQAATVIRQYPDMSILVEGHTDTDGGAEMNWQLSANRALVVAQDLIADGVNPAVVTAAGRAFYDPLVPNTSPANKAMNRRTEIILTPNYDELYELIRE